MRKTYFHRLGLGALALLCGAWVLLVMAPQTAVAQVLYGSVVGHVTDPTGAAVPGATVTITNKETNQSREATTEQTGSYNLVAVQTGTYTVKVSKAGFKSYEKSDIPVTLNAVMRVDVTLEVGAVTEMVTVTAEAALLQTDRGEVRTGLVSKELASLPVPLGRNYQQMFRALPGFSPPENAHSIPTNPSRALVFNVNGTSRSSNNTRIDGASSTNIQLPHVVAYIPSLESIQEVNVVTNSFDAEQGLAGGAAINVQLKSGTNEIHGSLFEYHSNQHLKAAPDFTPAGVVKGKLVYNQFGGTIGGPIKKDKLFYFVSYEGTYDRRNAQRQGRIPTLDLRQGDFSAALDDGVLIYDPYVPGTNTLADPASRVPFSVSPGDANYALCDTSTNPQCLNIIPAARLQDPSGLIAQKMIDLMPEPNIAASRNYFASAPFSFTRNTIDSKVNWNPTSRLTTFGRFSYLRYTSLTNQFYGELGGQPIRAGSGTSNPGRGSGNVISFTGAVTYTFSPHFLVDAYYGYTRQKTSSEQARLDENLGLDFLGIPGTNGTRLFEGGWPQFDIDGFETLGINSNFMPYYRSDPQHQYVANFNWTKGTHNVRFGMDFYRQALNHTQAEFLGDYYGAAGGFFFDRGPTQLCTVVDPVTGDCLDRSDSSRANAFASFLLGLPVALGKTLQVPEVYHWQATLYSLYGRDRWNVTPKLTIDYGLRWEYFPYPRRQDRGIERYDTETNQVSICGVGSVPVGCGVELSKRRFAPRLGLAYRATNTFVIRAGYGITNDPFAASEGLRANYPVLIPFGISSPGGNSLLPAGSLAQGIPPIVVPDFGDGVIDIPNEVAFQGLPKKFERGYIQSWNIMLQKQLGYGFTAQAGYVATRQVRQLGYLDINAGQVLGAGDDGRPLFAKFGRIGTTLFVAPLSSSHYDSLQATLERRFTQGLQLTINYTWSKALGNVAGNDDQPNVQALPYFHLNRSLTNYDRPHNLEVMSIWELPFGKGRRWLSNGGVASAILSGWQMNNFASFMSGIPFTVYASGNMNMPGTTQTADQISAQVQKLGGIGEGNPFYDPTAFADVNEARFGTSGYNSLRGPGIVNWDFGVTREFSISERWKLQFRMESFNFSNTPHFGNPDSDVTSDTFMVTDYVTNLAREGIDERQFRFGLRLSF